MKSVNCLLCGKEASLKYEKYPGYLQPNTFEIYHCSSCNTAFSYPRVETGKIYEAIYKNVKIVPGYNRYWNYLETVKSLNNPIEFLANIEDTYWGVKEALIQIVKNKSQTKILEIGSGLGYLTYSLIKDGYHAVGLDISETAVKQAKETFGDYYVCADLFDFSIRSPESFDIVILTEVIEHVDKPLDFIQAIMTLLKPGGYAIITTPNKSFYPKNVIWVSDVPPVHCWWLSEDSIKYIAKRVNSNIQFINFSEYYQKHYKAINMKSIGNKLPSPTLGRNYELIKIEESNNTKSESFIKKLLSFFPFIKKLYRKLIRLLNPNIIVCKERGIVLAAVMQKK
jgi:SAM-dependent methyltransferase